MVKNNSYGLLRTKEIIAILDGDTKYGEYEFDDGTTTRITMPNLSGSNLCDISTKFGLPKTYYWDGTRKNLSRWQYFLDLLDHCIQENRCSDLLSFLFNKKRFEKVLFKHDDEEFEKAYNCITQTIIQEINRILDFSENELTIVGDRFIVRKTGSKVSVQAPKIKSIDREYIKSISSRAMEDVDQGNYDSAITKSRTLLEETFCYVIEKKNEIPSDSGNIANLYKQVRGLYNMHIDTNTDRRIKTLLSGLNSIVFAIAEMRNKDSDAHGVGENRINIAEHHARLFVNAAMTMADFILSVEKRKQTV